MNDSILYWLSDNQFICAWSFHEKLDFGQFWWRIDCHNISESGEMQYDVVRRYYSHWTLHAVFVSVLYPASLELLETVVCFLDFHEIKEGPRNKQ